MKFNPHFHRVQVFSRNDVRQLAMEAMSTLTPKQLTTMERELRITAGSVKNLNPRMCRRVIEWVQKEEKL